MAGQNKHALDFDGGVNDFVRVPDSNSLDLSTEMTMLVWFDRDRSGTREIPVGKGNGTGPGTMEVGRINKTVYLLNYVNDESYRRRILTQLNRTEKRHNLARVICHGRRGEMRKRYREGQEDQLGILGLVTNVAVLWNTIYMQDALNHLKQNGLPILDNDIAGLWPLRHEHINVLGHYSFTLADAILAGEHRPLNQLDKETMRT